ncbi:MAG: hypothetical protein CVU86_07090 [Firmicutes bacterium HGW-Firmicutes-11]|nr:MAG: hypothetical protein CVU86_07090 [Firmicutes bacterium HGW-Firmicutes-11]
MFQINIELTIKPSKEMIEIVKALTGLNLSAPTPKPLSVVLDGQPIAEVYQEEPAPKKKVKKTDENATAPTEAAQPPVSMEEIKALLAKAKAEKSDEGFDVRKFIRAYNISYNKLSDADTQCYPSMKQMLEELLYGAGWESFSKKLEVITRDGLPF